MFSRENCNRNLTLLRYVVRRDKMLISARSVVVKVAGFLVILAVVAGATACSAGNAGTQAQQTSSADVAQLQQQVKDLQVLSPGLGEFMLGFQTHIAKVWFAGENGNWPLAKFETGEIIEGIDGAKASRPATGPLLDAFTSGTLAQLDKAIDAKDKSQFEATYQQTVDFCNGCHVGYTGDAKYPQGRPFIKITVPTQPPVYNQQWTP